MKRFDLMHGSIRAARSCVRSCACRTGRARQSAHPDAMAPPLNFAERWFAPHVAYSISKYGMSLCVLGLAGELRDRGVAVNALWPRTVIGTAALQVAMAGSRKTSGAAPATHRSWPMPRTSFSRDAAAISPVSSASTRRFCAVWA